MPRQQDNVVYIETGFVQSRQLINSKLNTFDVVELRAKDRFIELAIQLAQYFVKEGFATYDKFSSSLTTNSDDEPIPQISIKLAYAPQKPKEQSAQKGERKEYRQRQQVDSRSYKEEDRNYDNKQKNRRERENRRFG